LNDTSLCWIPSGSLSSKILGALGFLIDSSLFLVSVGASLSAVSMNVLIADKKIQKNDMMKSNKKDMIKAIEDRININEKQYIGN
jgi:hypothetical protein